MSAHFAPGVIERHPVTPRRRARRFLRELVAFLKSRKGRL